MLIPVAEHYVAQEQAARLGQDFFSAGDQAPGFVHGLVVECGQDRANGSNALVECLEHFLAGGRFGEIEIGSLGRIVLRKLNDASGNQGEVEGELAGGQGFLMRLPG